MRLDLDLGDTDVIDGNDLSIGELSKWRARRLAVEQTQRGQGNFGDSGSD